MYVSDLNDQAMPESPGDEPEEVEVVFIPADRARRLRKAGTGFFELAAPEADGESFVSSLPATAAGTDDVPEAPAEIASLDEKLEMAWEHLRRNELDDAMAIAKEASRKHPDVAAAKMILARCYINRKEYQKSLAILNAIPDRDKNAEAFYFLGLCRGRMGNVPKAMEALEESIAGSADEQAKKRAGDLLRHLRGGRAACPECGGQVQYADLVDVGNKTVCPDCARELSGGSAAGEPGKAEAVPVVRTARGGGFIKKLLRRAASLFLLFGLAYAGLYAASRTVPDQYENIRARLPEAWSFLPKTGKSANSLAESSEPPGSAPSDLSIDSPLIEYAISGIPLVHRLSVDGVRGVEGDYEALFSPEPRGRYRVDDRNGEFYWAPGEDDVGKNFDITFGVTFKASRAREQVNKVRVYSPPQFRNIYTPINIDPGEILHLLSGDLTGDGNQEIVAVAGKYWNARVTVLQETADGFFHPLGKAAFSGRPAGAGLLDVDGEIWVSIADYWNSRLRHYALRDGNVMEVPLETILPGRPVMAGFDRASGISAALCKLDGSMRLVAYHAVDWSLVEKTGDWTVPSGHVWRKVLMLPEQPGTGLRPRALLVGSDPEGSVFLASPEESGLIRVGIPVAGTLIDAALAPDGRVHCLFEADGQYSLGRFAVGADGSVLDLNVAPLGSQPLLNGIACLDLFGDRSGDDTAFLSAAKLDVAFSGKHGYDSVAQWDLPIPSRLLGQAVTLRQGDGVPERIVYQDVNGSLWCAGLSAPRENGK